MEEKMTLKKVLEMTRSILEDISIPVSMIQQIGIPVSRAVENLNACVDAISQQEANQFQDTGEEEPADGEDA